MWVSFKQFAKDPIKAILFLCLMSIGYMYYDNKMVNTDRINYLMEENAKKDQKIDKLENDIQVLYTKISNLK